jgi:PPOX class probable F420-dependent enzyme
MPSMTPEEVLAFLGEGTRTGHAATVRADGRAHVAPIWFVPDGPPDDLVILFTTNEETVKGRNLRRDQRMSLSVDDPLPLYSFVVVEGTVSLSDDLALVRDIATRCGGRYMGADRAESYGARNAVPGELAVRLTPSRVVSARDLAD